MASSDSDRRAGNLLTARSAIRLSDYLDGSLGRQDQAWLEVHLSTCSSCGAFARTLESTVELVHRLPRPRLPAADRARLRQQIVAAARGLCEAHQEAVGAAPGNPVGHVFVNHAR